MRSPTGSHLGKSDLEKYVFEYRFRARIFQRNSLFGGQRHTPLCFNDPLKSVGRFQNQSSLNKYLAKFLRFAEKCCSQRLAITTLGRNTSWQTLLMDKARSNNIFCNNFLFVPPPHKLTNYSKMSWMVNIFEADKNHSWGVFLKNGSTAYYRVRWIVRCVSEKAPYKCLCHAQKLNFAMYWNRRMYCRV